MTRTLAFPLLAVFAVISTTGCAGGLPAGGPDRQSAAAPGEPQRTLVMANRAEPPSIAAKRLETSSVTWGTTLRLANAYLTLADDRAIPRPYLAERLPQLNTDTWRVLPDGRMETAYHLKPNLIWHDGAPLSAEDFVFAWQLYSTPELGVGLEPPISLIEEVDAPDPRTVLVRWRASYPEAGQLGSNLPPVPKHVLDRPFREARERSDFDSLIGHRYWNLEYVGAGPFRLERWEPGAFIDLVAFDGHVLGRPRIDRLQLRFISDANTLLANLLSGEVHLSVDDSIRFQQGAVLRREWEPGKLGSVLVGPTQWRYTYIQLRSELAKPLALMDLRVRRALAHTLDRQSLNDGLFDGEGMMTETMIPSMAPVFGAVDRAIAKYPYDARRAEQLMAEAGWAKSGDGFFTGPGEGRFSADLKVLQSAHNDAEAAIMAAGWRQVGFDVREGAFTAAQGRDAQARATFSGMHSTSSSDLGERQFATNQSSQIPTTANRWRGGNRSGWANLEHDRLFETFSTTLDRSARDELVVRMAKLFSEELPGLSLYFGLGVVAHVAGLRGPQVVPPEANISWNIHEWEFR